MTIPYFKEISIASYLLKQRIMGRKRYPLVLMLEPLFRCNLACAGCGKIDYPDPILNQRLSVKEGLDAVDECGAPVGGGPGVVDPRRRAAAPPRDRAGRRGHHRAQEIRLPLHQRAPDGKEDRPVQAESVLRLVGALGRRPRDA